MGIYLKGKTYWMIKQHKGRKVEISLCTRIKREAEKRYAETLSKITDGSFFLEPKLIPTVNEVMERYMREVSPIHLSHNRNEAIFKYWNEYFGYDRLMNSVTTSLIVAYKSARLNGEIIHQKRKATASTVKKELSFLRQVFNHASEYWEDDWDGYFKEYLNPVNKALKNMADRERTRYLLAEEAEALAKHLPAWLCDIVIVAAETGYRRGRVTRLLKAEIDLEKGWINIFQKAPRAKNVRPIKMTSVLREHLKNVLLKSNPKSQYVFSDENGNPYSPLRISVAFGRACKAAKIYNLRIHDLRHDFASRLINAGVSLYQVQHQLAHSDPRTTQRYSHLDPSNRNVVDKIDGTGTTTILLREKEKELQIPCNSLN